MRHQVVSKRLGCRPSHRRMLINQLVTSLVEHGRVTTTVTRAKAIRPVVDRMVLYAKDGSLTAKRAARRVILNPNAFKRLFGEIRKDFLALENHSGGASRIIRSKLRQGDNASLVVMELLNFKPKPKEKKEGAEDKKGSPTQRRRRKKDQPPAVEDEGQENKN